MPSISILIVTYNSADVILACLRGVADAGYEIIVVDNASQDDTTALISTRFPQVRLVRSAENRGFGAGQNLAATYATGDLLVIANPDLVLTPDVVEGLATYISTHADVGVVGPRIVDAEDEVVISARAAFTPLRLLAKFYGLERFSPALVYNDRHRRVLHGIAPFETAWVEGACLALHRTWFTQIGGFDDELFLFCEDADLCKRTWDAGRRVIYLPSVTVTHYGSTSVSRARLVSTRWYHLAPIYYFRKHGMAAWVAKLGMVGELTIKAVKRRLRGDRQGAAIHWQVLRELLLY